MFKKYAVAMMALVWCGTSHAQLFSGPAAFTVTPISQIGIVTNNLVLNNTPTGFVVTGQLLITIPPGTISGLLAAFTVDRPLNPGFGTGTFMTTTTVTGFSAPPPGTFGNTFGQVFTVWTNPGVGSISNVPLALVGGVDLPPWAALTASSPTFSYTSGGVNSMQQRFQIDGNQIAGPGGVWTLDFPIFSNFVIIPEPSSILLTLSLVAGLGMGIRKLRSAK